MNESGRRVDWPATRVTPQHAANIELKKNAAIAATNDSPVHMSPTGAAQTSCDSAGSSDPGHHRTEPLFITGNNTRVAALGEPRIRAGEIIGWRFWKLCNGLLYSVFASYTWRPGVFERSAFRDKEQARGAAFLHACWSPRVIGSVAMWGEVVEHQHGWRSEYAAVQSITEITGDISLLSSQWLLQDLREKYCCKVVTAL
jgi:hypothetical protein